MKVPSPFSLLPPINRQDHLAQTQSAPPLKPYQLSSHLQKILSSISASSHLSASSLFDLKHTHIHREEQEQLLQQWCL